MCIHKTHCLNRGSCLDLNLRGSIILLTKIFTFHRRRSLSPLLWLILQVLPQVLALHPQSPLLLLLLLLLRTLIRGRNMVMRYRLLSPRLFNRNPLLPHDPNGSESLSSEQQPHHLEILKMPPPMVPLLLLQ